MKITYLANAYLNNYTKIEDVVKGECLPLISDSGEYFERQGFPQIGTVEVIITLHSHDQVVSGQITGLKKQLEKQRADAHMAERAILDRISNLQALTLDTAGATHAE